jgi:hypothetical protein
MLTPSTLTPLVANAVIADHAAAARASRATRRGSLGSRFRRRAGASHGIPARGRIVPPFAH